MKACPERSRMGGDAQQDEVDTPHPLHSLRSFSGCHTTQEQQSTGEVGSTETNAGELKKQTQRPACGRKSETRNPKPETHEAQTDSGELKKRTQSAAVQNDTSSCAARDYDAGSRPGPGENKADRTGFESARRADPTGKGKIGAASPAS